MRDRIETGERQTDYLLDYGRRRILNCADTFAGLAAAFAGMCPAQEGEAQKLCDRESLWRERQARENGMACAFYMQKASGLMQEAACPNVRIVRLGGRQEKQIVKALAGEGILVRDICLIRGQEDRIELCVSLCTRRDTTVTSAELAGYLSVLMNVRLVAQERNPYFIGRETVNVYFEEEPAFCYLSASATAVRENETVSGDSFSFFEEDGKVTAILSDGVGSGETAAADSSRVVDLTERMLETGLDCRTTLEMLNGMACAGNAEEQMPTLDLCRIDLRKGECEIAKAGAVSTYIKRGALVEKISADTLPLGLSRDMGQEPIVRSLRDQDMVILLSDGAVDDWLCMDGEFFMMRQIEQLTVSSPVEMANLLLRHAIGQSQGRIRDDMTVLVAGIWENPQKN